MDSLTENFKQERATLLTRVDTNQQQLIDKVAECDNLSANLDSMKQVSCII